MPSPEDLDTGSFSSAAMAADVVAAMAMFETRLYNAFLRFVKTITDDVALMSLLDDIQNGVYIAMTPGVEDRLAQVNIPTKDLARIQRQALARAARTTAKNVGMTGRLDLTSPTAIDKARKITAEMVRYVTEETKAALRELVGQVVAGDMTKAAAKRLIGQRVGLLPQHANAVGKYYDKLLETFDRGRAQEMADQYAQRLLEYRAENIARTEIARAMSSGQLEVWEQMQAQGLLPSNVMRTWIVSFDERLCRLCEPMNGITAAIDGTWLTTNGILVRVPTDIHPQCRCTSGLVFVDEVGKADPLGWEHWQIAKHYDHDQRSHGNWARGQQAQAPVALANRLAGESPIEEFPKAKVDEITSRLLGKGTFGDYAAKVIEDKYGFTKSEMTNAGNQLQALVGDLYNIHYNRPEHDRVTYGSNKYGSMTAADIAASIIDSYSRSWSHSSSNEPSMVLKFAAGKWLGASASRDYGEHWQGRLDKLQERFDKFLVESPEGAKFLKAFVEIQYETTQKVFAELGVTHVLLSRGLGLEGKGYSKQEKASGRPVISNWADITVADLDTTSDQLSSWSYSISSARKFGATKQYDDTSSGAMLYARVPVANIFSFSGLGVSTSSYAEGEVVLLGRPQRVLSFRANKAKLNKYAPSRWEDVLEAANSYGTDIFDNTSGGLSKHYEHDQRSHGNWARYRAEDQRAMLAEMDVAGQFKRSNKPANYKDVLRDTDAIEKLFKVEGSFVDENGVTKKWEATDIKVKDLFEAFPRGSKQSSADQIAMGFIKVEGKTVGHFSRHLYRDGTVKHSRFFMNENFSGKGIGGSFIKQTVANVKEAGFKKIKIGSIMQSFYTGEAGQNNGTLVWAKLGFKLESWGGPDKIKTSRQLVDAYQKELDLLTKMAMDPSNRRATDTLVRAKERVITNRDNDAKFPLLINGLSAEYSLDLTKPLPETLAKAAEWDLDVWDDVLSEWVEPPLDDGATS